MNKRSINRNLHQKINTINVIHEPHSRFKLSMRFKEIVNHLIVRFMDYIDIKNIKKMRINYTQEFNYKGDIYHE